MEWAAISGGVQTIQSQYLQMLGLFYRSGKGNKRYRCDAHSRMGVLAFFGRFGCSLLDAWEPFLLCLPRLVGGLVT